MADTRAMQAQLEELRRRVDVDNYTITIRELLSMTENRELHRAPTYQRKFRWDEETQSRLIESLLLGLPVPNLFFATNADGTWEIVDGLQRVSTLIHFAPPNDDQLREVSSGGPLTLTGMRMLTHFEGLAYDDLPMPVRLAFTKRGMGVTALSDKSDPQTRFDTFERLNRGAVALSYQEVRACLFDGPLNELLRELAENPTLKQVVKLQKTDKSNASMEELVLKFFAYRHNRKAFAGSVRDFLNDWMEANKDTDRIDEFRDDFLRSIDAVHGALDGQPFLRSQTRVTPKNEFEGVIVAASEVFAEHGKIGKPPAGWPNDPALVDASTKGTNAPIKLNARIDRAKEILTPSKS